MVCGERPRAGDLYGHLDTLHFLLRHLLQTGRTHGEKTLMPIDLLLCGAVVFALLLIGLVYTVIEFSKMK
jgi:hypothetical protein